jgi:hypothetical protein
MLSTVSGNTCRDAAQREAQESEDVNHFHIDYTAMNAI